MAMTAEQLYQARTWLPWTSITDADLNTRYDALGEDSILPLVREQLRRQLMIALTTPAQFNIAGEYGQTTTENISGIRAAMKEVDAEMAVEAGNAGLGTSSLVRPDPYRAGRTAAIPAGLISGPKLL